MGFDIGMQCDVVRFPEIVERAEELEATFETEFTAQTANSYEVEEQKDIRKNHQYLSAAWIDVARATSGNVLHIAAQGIPLDLVGDLRDVCVHHSKLPISSCDVSFALDPKGRKRFLAALLRFSDELDIDTTRVEIETVKMYRLDPRNSVYWWMHNATRITFPATNLVNLSVVLHPDDYERYGPRVHDAFISEFRTKNSPVISILAQNSLPIVIDSESKVVEIKEAERLPAEIVQALDKTAEHADPLADLASEIGTWLRAIRYEVGDVHTFHDRVAEMTATMEQGSVKQRVLA